MEDFYVDLHVHIGRNGRGKPVKITASPNLTFEAIIKECVERKGVQMVGIIDCACTGVLQDMRRLIDRGQLLELPEGGLRHRESVTVIAGAEVEAVEPDGGVSHHLCYFPYLRNLAEFSKIMGRYITNMELSSQRCGLPARELLAVVQSTGGILIPAHAFTPHKSAYGNATDRLGTLFGQDYEEVVAVEVGLSSDAELADRIEELEERTFLTNSDAHSVAKIGREVNLIRMEASNFKELMLALRREQGRRVVANYGMDPKLGRYHRSFCLDCETSIEGAVPALKCACGAEGKRIVKGVLDRVTEIADFETARHPEHRSAYHYHVPLSFIPKLGKTSIDALIGHVGSEMKALYEAPKTTLAAAVGWSMAERILRARRGDATLIAGGGGKHGKWYEEEARQEEQLLLF